MQLIGCMLGALMVFWIKKQWRAKKAGGVKSPSPDHDFEPREGKGEPDMIFSTAERTQLEALAKTVAEAVYRLVDELALPYEDFVTRRLDAGDMKALEPIHRLAKECGFRIGPTDDFSCTVDFSGRCPSLIVTGYREFFRLHIYGFGDRSEISVSVDRLAQVNDVGRLARKMKEILVRFPRFTDGNETDRLFRGL